MAAGSVVSRATGFARSAVVAAALGTIGPTADGYAVGNALPTIVYMLLLGGALNAVFVPELVKAAKEHDDGGAAYTDRLVTVCVLALLAITATAVWAAPAIVDAYTDYTGPQAAMTTALARYCLPQIFFLGLFTLLGQVLNARGRFGAMMWAPVLNNLVVMTVFGLYLALAMGGGDTLTATETAVLGWGTTAGIAVQALALLPALRAARFRWRPRFDWRGSGLTRPLRAAGWLVLLVLANQAAYWVTTRLATTARTRRRPRIRRVQQRLCPVGRTARHHHRLRGDRADAPDERGRRRRGHRRRAARRLPRPARLRVRRRTRRLRAVRPGPAGDGASSSDTAGPAPTTRPPWPAS